MSQRLSGTKSAKSVLLDFINDSLFGELTDLPDSIWRHDYQFFGNNKQFFDCRDRVVCLHGPKECGKTIVALSKLHLLALQEPGMVGGIIRKVREDMSATVLVSWEDKVLPKENEDGQRVCFYQGKKVTVTPYGGKSPQWYDYSNGSRVYVAGLDRPGKIQSGEPDVLVVNQAEELTTEDIETLSSVVTGRGGRLHNGNVPQVLLECNPGGASHPIKILDAAGALTMIQARHRDNPTLYDQETGEITEQGEMSLGALKKLTGVRLQRNFYGQWAGAEGLFFSNFDTYVHGLNSVPDLSTMVEFWASMDYGFNHWNVFQLHCQNGDGVHFTLQELCHRKHYPHEIAPDILGSLSRYNLTMDNLTAIYTGSDTFAKTGHALDTVADQYREHGVGKMMAWESGPGSRTTKSHHLLRMLGSQEDGRVIPPSWYYVAENCKRLADCIPGLVPDPTNPEQVKKVDCSDNGDGGDDSYDCLVGGLLRSKISTMA